MLTSSVFTYGTLQIPEVMFAVTGSNFKSTPAKLNGYLRLKIKDTTYPAIIKKNNCSVDGELYRNIDQKTLILLDQFEDICYERLLVNVNVAEKKEKAFVYVWKNEYKNQLSDKEWSLEEFKRKYLKLYINRISDL